ncbi:unnamed protein product [Triticum turgidum subsp. durum]|uniref:Brix domain-containing protein n=1 Tax=Triticum turgidum subsp. durum TaxID=4567 RepID=A0A9R0VYY7_TRITD|nr:unnamed protein product [Triticum turgidum subsp. durum]
MARVRSNGRRGGGSGGGGGRGGKGKGKGKGPGKWKMPLSVARKQQAVLANVDQVTGERIPKSFVFSRGKLPSTLRHLQQDLRKLMLPYTALKLKEKKRNNLKDFVNVASPLGVTHFLILSNPKSLPHLRFAKSPQGPTYTCQISEYALAADIANSQKRPRCPAEPFKSFVTFFRHLVPAIDTDTVKLSTCQRILLLQYDKETEAIDFRHYSIKLQPVGISRKIRKLMQNNQVPDLRDLKDVSDYVTKAGYGSESEPDDEAATVSLASDIDKLNRASRKSAVRLQEVGPRMTMRLVKVESGLCSGDILYPQSVGKEDVKEGQEEEEIEDAEDMMELVDGTEEDDTGDEE